MAKMTIEWVPLKSAEEIEREAEEIGLKYQEAWENGSIKHSEGFIGSTTKELMGEQFYLSKCMETRSLDPNIACSALLYIVAVKCIPPYYRWNGKIDGTIEIKQGIGALRDTILELIIRCRNNGWYDDPEMPQLIDRLTKELWAMEAEEQAKIDSAKQKPRWLRRLKV